MIEFMIRPSGTAEFEFKFSEYPRVLKPKSIASSTIKGWGSNRICVEGEEISFSDEGRGFQVSFHTGAVGSERATEIIEDICANIAAETGFELECLQISGWSD